MTNKLRWKMMFLKDGELVSQHNQHEVWTVGKWRHHDMDPVLCEEGFHCSQSIQHAMGYIPGDIVARVAVKGASDIGGDKESYSSMKIVRAYRWCDEDSVALAIFSAELVLHLFEDRVPGDRRPREAIEVAKTWLSGNETAGAAGPAWAAGDARAARDAARAARDAARAAGAARAARAAGAAARAAGAAGAARAAGAAAGAAWAAWAVGDARAVGAAIEQKIEQWIIDRLAQKQPLELG